MASNSWFHFGSSSRSAKNTDSLSSNASKPLSKAFISPRSVCSQRTMENIEGAASHFLAVKLTNVSGSRSDQLQIIQVSAVTAKMKSLSALWWISSLQLVCVFVPKSVCEWKTHRCATLTQGREWSVCFCSLTEWWISWSSLFNARMPQFNSGSAVFGVSRWWSAAEWR